MEKRISFLEGFGDVDQGDGFQAASAAVAPGAPNMTACALFRFDTYDLSGTLAADNKFVCGNMSAGGGQGWGVIATPGDIVVQGGAGSLVTGYAFGDGDKPVGGRVLAVHMTVEPTPFPSARVSLYVNGTFISFVSPPGPAPTFGAGLMSIGANGDTGTFQSFGSSADLPSARNGIAGVSYGEFTMDGADVAEHYRQILEAEDVADGGFGWSNLWSVREGMPDLELAGGDAAEWVDEIGGAVLTRTQFNQQTPALQNTVRPARIY
jgi:hypothetical protein